MIFEDDIDKIDISKGTLTREYVNGKKTIGFKIKQNSLNGLLSNRIKKKIETGELKDLNQECELLVMPEFKNNLELTFDNGKTYRFNWTSNNCGEQVDDLNEIVRQLKSIIKEDKTVDQLEPSDIIFE